MHCSHDCSMSAALPAAARRRASRSRAANDSCRHDNASCIGHRATDVVQRTTDDAQHATCACTRRQAREPQRSAGTHGREPTASATLRDGSVDYAQRSAKPSGPHGVAWHGMAHGPLRGRCSRARTAAARSCPSTFPLSASNGPISHLVPVPDPAYLRHAMPLLHPQRWLGPTSARRPRQDGTVCSCCIAHAAAGWRTAMRPLDLRTIPAATARL